MDPITTINALTGLTEEKYKEIVRAVKAHDSLMAALELAIHYLKHPDVQAIPFALPASAALERAQAALAKAIEETD